VRSGEAVELEALDARRTAKGTEIAIANPGSRRACCGDGAPQNGLPVDRRNEYFRTVPVFEARGPLWTAQEEPLHRHRSALANKVHVFFRWSSSLRWRAPRLISCPGLSGGAKLGARARALCHQTIVPARQRTRVDVKKTASPAEIEITQTALILENPAESAPRRCTKPGNSCRL